MGNSFAPQGAIETASKMYLGTSKVQKAIIHGLLLICKQVTKPECTQITSNGNETIKHVQENHQRIKCCWPFSFILPDRTRSDVQVHYPSGHKVIGRFYNKNRTHDIQEEPQSQINLQMAPRGRAKYHNRQDTSHKPEKSKATGTSSPAR